MLPDNEENTYVEEAGLNSIIEIGDKVKFENVKRKYVCDPVNPSTLLVEYVIDKNMRPSTRDWLGLFPRGWNNLLQNIAFEYIVGRSFNEQERRWKVSVNLKFVKDDLYHPEFQFVFVSSDLQVLGTSSYFRFYKSEADAERANKFSGKNVKSEIQLFEKMIVSHNSDQQTPRSGTFSKIVDNEKKYWSLVHTCSDTPSLQNRNAGYYNCGNCARLPEILNVQHKLFQEVKNMAEAKKDLEDQIQILQNKLELSIAAQKKWRVAAEFEKHEKLTYQAIAGMVVKQIADSSVLRVSNGNVEVVVQPVRPSSPSFPQQARRTKSTSSNSMKCVELKAIIGVQNQKIQAMKSFLSRFGLAQAYMMQEQVKDAEEAPVNYKTNFSVTSSKINTTAAELTVDERHDLNNNS